MGTTWERFKLVCTNQESSTPQNSSFTVIELSSQNLLKKERIYILGPDKENQSHNQKLSSFVDFYTWTSQCWPTHRLKLKYSKFKFYHKQLRVYIVFLRKSISSIIALADWPERRVEEKNCCRYSLITSEIMSKPQRKHREIKALLACK